MRQTKAEGRNGAATVAVKPPDPIAGTIAGTLASSATAQRRNVSAAASANSSFDIRLTE